MSQKPLDNILMASHLQSAKIWYETQREERLSRGEPHSDLDQQIVSCSILINQALTGL